MQMKHILKSQIQESSCNCFPRYRQMASSSKWTPYMLVLLLKFSYRDDKHEYEFEFHRTLRTLCQCTRTPRTLPPSSRLCLPRLDLQSGRLLFLGGNAASRSYPYFSFLGRMPLLIMASSCNECRTSQSST